MTSWGKDSCALLSLATGELGRVDAAHMVSGYELPGDEHVRTWFSSRCNLEEVAARRPVSEIVEWLKTYGLGYERETLRGAGKKRKTDAALEWVKAHGYAVQMLGMRAAESKARRTCFRVRGLTYPAHGLTVSNPIGWWETRDVWAYLVAHGVPWHPLYDAETHGQTRETIRNAGWLTVQSDSTDWRVPWLRRHFPEQYSALAREFPQVRRLG